MEVEYKIMFCTGRDLGSSVDLTLSILEHVTSQGLWFFYIQDVGWERSIGLLSSLKDLTLEPGKGLDAVIVDCFLV